MVWQLDALCMDGVLNRVTMNLDSQELGIGMKTCHKRIEERWNKGTILVESLDERLATVEAASKRFNSSLEMLLNLKGFKQVEEGEKLKKLERAEKESGGQTKPNEE